MHWFFFKYNFKFGLILSIRGLIDLQVIECQDSDEKICKNITALLVSILSKSISWVVSTWYLWYTDKTPAGQKPSRHFHRGGGGGEQKIFHEKTGPDKNPPMKKQGRTKALPWKQLNTDKCNCFKQCCIHESEKCTHVQECSVSWLCKIIASVVCINLKCLLSWFVYQLIIFIVHRFYVT